MNTKKINKVKSKVAEAYKIISILPLKPLSKITVWADTDGALNLLAETLDTIDGILKNKEVKNKK